MVNHLRQPGQSSYQPSVAVVRDHKLRTAPKSIIFEVGKRTGQQIREGQSAEMEATPTGKRKRAHLRRGHWHGYWYGPRKGERSFGYRWLHPMVVGGE
jgi:hypothetical protein